MTTLEDARDVPEALRLADWVQSDFDPDIMYEFGYDQIATELRRLHREVEALRGGWRPIESGLPASVEFDIRFDDGSVLCGCLLQADGDVWWSGADCGERFFDPVFAPITHYRVPTPPAQEDWK